jgi:hypothetical protein
MLLPEATKPVTAMPRHQRARVDGAVLGDTDDTKMAGSDIGTIRKERMVARAKLNSYGEFRCARPVRSPLPPV